MINQEINLYQDRFREPRLILSAIQSLILVGTAVLLLAGASYHYDSQLQQQQSLNEMHKMEKQAAEAELAANRQKLEAELANGSPDERLQSLLRDIEARKRLIRFVENNSLISGEGFSARLAALSGLSVNEVWLNEISLADNYVRLSGSALKAEKIPLYFTQFKKREHFAGRVFDVFEVSRDQSSDWKVDFVIASRSENQ